MIRLRACGAVHSPVGGRVTPRMRMRLVACSMAARTQAWVPSSRPAVKKSHARIASAWQRGNCDQAGPFSRRPGWRPLVLRISQAVDAATLTPRPAISPRILRYPPARILAGQPADQGLDGPAGRWPAGPAARGPGGPAAADDVAVPARHRVRADKEPQALAA